MKIKNLFLAGVLALFALNAGAVVLDEAVATVNGKPVLESDFNKVSDAFIAQYAAAAPKVMEQPAAKLKIQKEVLDQMINDELLYQTAVKEGVKARDEEVDEAVLNAKNALIPAKDEKTGKDLSEKDRNKMFEDALKKENLSMKQFRDRLQKQIISRKYIETVLTGKVKPVTDADAKALFDEVKITMDAVSARDKAAKDVLENKKLDDKAKKAKLDDIVKKYNKSIESIKPEQHRQEVEAIAVRLNQLSAPKVKIGHIFIAAGKDLTAAQIKEKEAKAKDIKKQIDNGRDFGDAVKEYSEDKSSLQTGGDMILIKGQAPDAIDKAAFSLDVGKVSDPIRSDIGFHIIKVKEKSSGEEVTYEKVARDLGQFIAAQRIQAAVNDYIADLRSKADIKINKDFSGLDNLNAQAAAKPAATPAAQEPKK
ncbi:MAG: peptidylprolyl isomerase [Elusimicrobium sp.]|jgi:parvulin-like peptidyl-prolyl isomerase|nr:peptidylprolyl isomerase [Elusimicrobium sp.]